MWDFLPNVSTVLLLIEIHTLRGSWLIVFA
jgi:hypothetical protein